MAGRFYTRFAWPLWALCVVLVAFSTLLLTLNFSGPDPIAPYFLNNAVATLAFSTVGAIIASRQPENLIGWLFILAGLLFGIALFTGEYGVYAHLAKDGALPAGVVALWIASWLWIPAGSVALFLFLLFPDGRLPSPRWRIVAWLAALAICLQTASFALAPGPLEGLPGLPPVENPFSVEGVTGILNSVEAVLFPLLGLLPLAPITALIVRFRRAGGEERQQIKWVAYAVAMLTTAIVAVTIWPALDPSILGRVLFMAGFLAIPTSMGIAIFKYRLYDIDRIINRTLIYGILTVSLVLIYVGGVAGLQYVFRAVSGQESQLAIVASTLAIAALFGPLRRRIQDFIDRRFYRRKYDAAKMLEAFSAKLREETDLGQLSEDLISVVQETMQPSHVSLWLREPEKDG